MQVAHVDARLAEPLHRGQAHHDARPLDTGLVAAGAAMAVAPTAGREIDAFPDPLACERTHVLCRHAGLFLLPLRRLPDAVLFAEEICAPFIETDGVGLHVLLVVEVFLDPDVGDRHRHRDRGGGPGREPLARQELRRRVVVRIDVHDLDAELGILQPLPAHGAFLRAIGAARALGIGGPEHDHVAVLQAIFDRAVGLRLADAQRVAPVMHRAPVPAFPAVGIMVDLGVTAGVAEAEQRGEVITDIAPGVMGTVRHRHDAGTVGALEPLDLARDEVERLRPRNAHVARFAAVLGIALAVRVEVDALHRIEQAIGRINDRLRVLPMRGKRGLARRRELQSARFDGPWQWIIRGEVDRRHADDPAVLDVDENRSAVGHVAIAHGAVGKPRADLQADALAHHDGLREPVGEILRPFDGELEILLRVDLIEPVDRRHEQIGGDRGGLEGERDFSVGAQPRARRHLAVADRVPTADLLVAGLELRDEVALLEPRAEGRMPPGRVREKLRHPPQDDLELHRREHGLLLAGLHARGLSCDR